MKVTKLIREYVEEKVTAIYAPKIAAIDEQMAAQKKEAEAALAQFDY